MRRSTLVLAAAAAVTGGFASGCAVSATEGRVDHGAELDTARFDASGRVPEAVLVERVMNASAAEVFDTFTQGERMTDIIGVPAKIDLRIGGAFELWFAPDAPEGSRGSEDCRFLSYVPDRMVSFTWNAPPSIPDARDRRSWVVVEFDAVTDNATLVRLTHTGFGDGAAWDETRAYFERAWPGLLGAMQAGFAEKNPAPEGLDALAWMVGDWKGSAPGGGLTEAHWSRPLQGAIHGTFRWVTPDGGTLVSELSRFVETDDGVRFEIRHFDARFEPWDDERGGATALMLDVVEPRRALFRAANDEMDLRSIEYTLEGNTLTAVVTQRGEGSPFALGMTRVR